MMLESLDSRVLAALRFLDGETEQSLTLPVTVSGSGVRVIRNRWGLYVLTEAPGFEAYTALFETPSTPEPGTSSLALKVADPSGRHLPRSFSIDLPRDLAHPPVVADQSVFLPVDVRMYLAPVARPAPGSAVVRLSLVDDEEAPLAHVVIRLRVRISDTPVVDIEGLGMSDERGELLLLVPSIPVIRWGQEEGDALIHTTFPATLESAFAPVVAGLPAPDMPALTFTPLPQIPPLQVASGLEIHRRISIPTS